MTGAAALSFVVGTGRCGSTLLSRMFDDAAEVANVSEFFTLVGPDAAFPREPISGRRFWQLLNQNSGEIASLLDAGRIPEVDEEAMSSIRRDPRAALAALAFRAIGSDPAELCRELEQGLLARSIHPVSEHYRYVFDHLRSRVPGKRLVLERSGGSLAYVGTLAASFDGATFVHLFRRGHEAALSMSRHPYFRVLVARLIEKDASLPISACLERRIPLDRFGAFWSATVVRGVSVLSRLPRDRVAHVSFTELTERPAHTLQRLAGFLGVDTTSGWTERAATRVRRVDSGLASLRGEERATLERACLPGMRAIARLMES